MCKCCLNADLKIIEIESRLHYIDIIMFTKKRKEKYDFNSGLLITVKLIELVTPFESKYIFIVHCTVSTEEKKTMKVITFLLSINRRFC